MSTMIDVLREAFDAKWEALLADPLTPHALDLLAIEAIAEDDAGQKEEITGD